LFERLREYVAPVDPEMFVHSRGATDEDIAHYAALSGFEDAVPASYLCFMRAMGCNDGGLFIDLRIEAKLESVIELYQDCLRTEPHSLNAELPVAALYVIGDQVSFDRRNGLAEPPLVDSADGELVRPLSRSWEALVMQAAILRVEPRRLAHGRWHSSSANSAAKALDGASAAETIDAFAAKLGLPIAWPSDARHRIAVDEHRSLFARIGDKDAVLLEAFSNDELFLHRVGNELAPSLGAMKGGVLRIVRGALRDSKS
jgi:hypothetical protein